jgi:type I restriction enzyme S subunit
LNFIDSENNKYEVAIDLQKKQIEKLKEYKTTLINSAVTGKIKVPEVA